jgi:hypothetical protein
MHVYEVRPRKDKRGVDLISDVLAFARQWYAEPNAISNAIGMLILCCNRDCQFVFWLVRANARFHYRITRNCFN